MISFVQTALIMTGKTQPALLWAHRIARHVAHHHDVEIEVLVPAVGNPQRIAWSSRYRSMVAWDEVQLKLAHDASYQALRAESASLLVPQSEDESLWRASAMVDPTAL